MSSRAGAVRFPQRQFSGSWVVGRALRPALFRQLSVSISFREFLLFLCLVFLLGLQVLLNSYVSQMRGQTAVLETEVSRCLSKNEVLRREEQQLKKVENIEASAKRMGLNPPQKNQIVQMTAVLK